MTTFSFPSTLLDRLSRLHLATDGSLTAALGHLHLVVTPERFRFAATNGRLLAVVVGDITTPSIAFVDVLLDRDQFVNAIRSLTKGLAKGSPTGIQVAIDTSEVRLTTGLTSALVRRVQMVYPVIDHAFTKPAGMRWVPCVSTLDIELAATARKIAGTPKLLFSTPVPTSSPVPMLWASDPTATARTADLQPVVRGPAYWADHELAILLMPITRGDAEPQLDLTGFVMPAAQPTAVAA